MKLLAICIMVAATAGAALSVALGLRQVVAPLAFQWPWLAALAARRISYLLPVLTGLHRDWGLGRLSGTGGIYGWMNA